MRLVLGVLDIPYSNSSESQTTVDVAQILEDKYHVMQTFFDMHDKEIVGDIESGIAGAIENAIGGKKEVNLFAGAMSKTEQRFRDYLDKEEMAGSIQGVPTQAALDGITSRKKGMGLKMRKVDGKGKKFGVRRPSFIDSGMYRMSAKFWIEE